MKIDVLKKEKDFAEFFIEGERHTFPSLLKQKLLEMKEVEYASYVLEHPSDDKAKFVVKTNGKSPKAILDEAAKQVEADVSDFASKLAKALK